MPSPKSRTSVAIIALIGTLLAATLVSAKPTSSDYAGEFATGHGMVAVEVLRRGGRPVEARFTATNVEVFCEGDSEPQLLTMKRLRARFVGPRVFEGRVRPLPQPGESQTLFKFQGKLIGKAAVRGFVFYRDDPVDTPSEENVAECSTDGLLRWSATREG